MAAAAAHQAVLQQMHAAATAAAVAAAKDCQVCWFGSCVSNYTYFVLMHYMF